MWAPPMTSSFNGSMKPFPNTLGRCGVIGCMRTETCHEWWVWENWRMEGWNKCTLSFFLSFFLDITMSVYSCNTDLCMYYSQTHLTLLGECGDRTQGKAGAGLLRDPVQGTINNLLTPLYCRLTPINNLLTPLSCTPAPFEGVETSGHHLCS